MTGLHPAVARADAFRASFGLRIPILLAPMAGACPPSLSIAVAGAVGLGACGAVAMQPAEIRACANTLEGLSAWAGQSAARARASAAAEVARELWEGARALLGPV